MHADDVRVRETFGSRGCSRAYPSRDAFAARLRQWIAATRHPHIRYKCPERDGGTLDRIGWLCGVTNSELQDVIPLPDAGAAAVAGDGECLSPHCKSQIAFEHMQLLRKPCTPHLRLALTSCRSMGRVCGRLHAASASRRLPGVTTHALQPEASDGEISKTRHNNCSFIPST